ncbi:hypothetical protein FKM82_025693 [Ascaphus truei]
MLYNICGSSKKSARDPPLNQAIGPNVCHYPPYSYHSVLNEDKKKFKTCSQIGFYRRQKLLLPGRSPYHARLETLTVGDDSATLEILHQDTEVPLQLQVFAVEGDILRLKINEVSPLKPRYEVPNVLVKEPATQRLIVSKTEEGSVVLEHASGPYKLHVTAKPFCVSVTNGDKLVLSVNSQGLLYFEHLRSPPPNSATAGCGSDSSEVSSQDELGLWREQFGAFVDIKASGPTSVGMDFSLYGFEHVYGLPEHADTHQLRDTG